MVGVWLGQLGENHRRQLRLISWRETRSKNAKVRSHADTQFDDSPFGCDLGQHSGWISSDDVHRDGSHASRSRVGLVGRQHRA
jgi:hypothetical protein